MRDGSPVKDFYPIDFKIDMNGKKNEWESVVVVPFIDEQRLLVAAQTKEHLLSAEEANRNGFGPDIIYTYDPKLSFTFPSPSPIFPEIKNCPCRATKFTLPPVPSTGYCNGILPGARLGKKILPGFPTLKTLTFQSSLRVHGANLFGHDSRNPSIVFKMAPNAETPEQLARKVVGKTCFIDWPFLREAQVIALTDALFAYTLDPQKQVISTPLTQEQLHSYPRIMKDQQSSLEKKGIFTGVIPSILHVTPLKGLKVNSAGGLSKEYSNEVVVTIPALTVFEVEQEDPRFVAQQPLSLEKKYPVGHSVIFLAKKGYGSVGTIGKHPADAAAKKLNVKLADYHDEDPAFLAQLSEREVSEQYTAIFSVSKNLGISHAVLNRLTASFYVKDPSHERVNVGLNFKFSKQNQKVLGYSRRRAPEKEQTEGVWELSRKAIDLIQAYQRAFPDFFQALEDLPFEEKTPGFLEVASSAAEFQRIVDWRASHKLDK